MWALFLRAKGKRALEGERLKRMWRQVWEEKENVENVDQFWHKHVCANIAGPVATQPLIPSSLPCWNTRWLCRRMSTGRRRFQDAQIFSHTPIHLLFPCRSADFAWRKNFSLKNCSNRSYSNIFNTWIRELKCLQSSKLTNPVWEEAPVRNRYNSVLNYRGTSAKLLLQALWLFIFH